jgi:putative FmdB family regulatory protein
MPLYEYHCPSCRLTFEALEPLRGARRPGTCPRCRRRAPRVSSAFSMSARGGGSEGKSHAGSAAAAQAKPEQPFCLRYPQVPLLCHMDSKSAERFVAQVQGRGAQYDDTVAAREELRKKRGDPQPADRAPSGHAHPHEHSHGGKKTHAHAHPHARHTH